MHSRTDAAGLLPALALALALGSTGVHAADAPPTRAQVQAAADALARDPALPGRKTERSLRFKTPDSPPPARDDSFRWLADLVKWLAESARLLVWGVGAVLAAVLLVGLWRWRRARGDALVRRPGALPAHVRSLDIRPESLPDVVGAAAAQLWRSGRARDALSLLYRGALSRLVHQHGVPVRAASTEGECLRLATGHVDTARSAFFAQLVGVWQLAVYAARLPQGEQVLALCEAFDLHWPRQAAA
ncbi:MAG: DUF4129 domain-containing protein [Pseudomonadota bacterium]